MRLVNVLADLDMAQLIETARKHKATFGGKTVDAARFIVARAYNKGIRGATPRLPEN